MSVAKTYTARGLTVREVREAYAELEDDYQVDAVDLLFDGGLPAPIFYRSLGVADEDRELLSDPELLEDLMASVARANPDLIVTESTPRSRRQGNSAEELDIAVSRLVLLGFSDPWPWPYSQLCQTLKALEKISKDKK